MNSRSIESALKKLTKQVAVTSLYWALPKITNENPDGGMNFITTQKVENLEDIDVLVAEGMSFKGWAREHCIEFMKALYTEIDDKNNERVLGFFCWWKEGDIWYFGTKIFGGYSYGYMWNDNDFENITSWDPKDSFIDKENWREIVYCH